MFYIVKYDILGKILNSHNLFELADNLEHFIEYVNNVPNKKKECVDLYEEVTRFIFTYSFGKSHAPYIIYDEHESVLVYLTNYWDIQNTAKQNIKILSEIIERIRTEMLPSKETILSENTMIELLEHVDKRFSFYDKILKIRPIKILCLNHSHVEWNCFYTASLYFSGTIDDCVMMTYMSNDTIKICRQEFGFLHELGHIVHTRLTGKLHTPPKSFRLIQKLIFPKSLDDPEVPTDELFADCFAIAALHDSPFAVYDPNKNLKEADKLMLSVYMYLLIQESEDISEEQFIASFTDYLIEEFGTEYIKKILGNKMN